MKPRYGVLHFPRSGWAVIDRQSGDEVITIWSRRELARTEARRLNQGAELNQLVELLGAPAPTPRLSPIDATLQALDDLKAAGA